MLVDRLVSVRLLEPRSLLAKDPRCSAAAPAPRYLFHPNGYKEHLILSVLTVLLLTNREWLLLISYDFCPGVGGKLLNTENTEVAQRRVAPALFGQSSRTMLSECCPDADLDSWGSSE
jgi:hypothetical protein